MSFGQLVSRCSYFGNISCGDRLGSPPPTVDIKDQGKLPVEEDLKFIGDDRGRHSRLATGSFTTPLCKKGPKLLLHGIDRHM